VKNTGNHSLGICPNISAQGSGQAKHCAIASRFSSGESVVEIYAQTADEVLANRIMLEISRPVFGSFPYRQPANQLTKPLCFVTQKQVDNSKVTTLARKTVFFVTNPPQAVVGLNRRQGFLFTGPRVWSN
jgi:hypothetical protein